MCGIAGLFAYHDVASDIQRSQLVAMSEHMRRRGPDGSGIWIADDNRIAFAHRRLAIIDLSDNGLQPMQTRDGRYVVVFNGEIYNYRELRHSLSAAGYSFRTACDTEVLLNLYADRGVDMVHDLRGMFAFALWDMHNRQLILARDPYGIKPLYYSDDGRTCRFASQVKTLRTTGAISNERDPAGEVGFYLFGSVPEPFTTWQAIRSVPSGATLIVDRSGVGTPRKYYSIARIYCAAEQQARSGSAGHVQVREALLDSVRCHLVADVPVGAFLSAGIDSGALVGLMRDAGAHSISTVTVGFEEFRGSPQDETRLATEVAHRYGTVHTTRIVTRKEFEDDLPLILEAMDQPSIDGVNTWFAAKAARELGLKVAISGLGGDELFGGYSSFRAVPGWVRLMALPSRVRLPKRLLRRVAAGAAGLLGLHPKAAGLLEYGATYAGAYLAHRGLFLPWELEGLLSPEIVAEGLRRLLPLCLIGSQLEPQPRTPFGCVATLESSLYLRNQLLRDTDWASMTHSLEVRVPLVDGVLLGRLAAATVGKSDKDSKRLLAMTPSIPLPSQVAERVKTGFAMPVAAWTSDKVKTLKPAGQTSSGRRVPWARGWSRFVAEQLRAQA